MEGGGGGHKVPACAIAPFGGSGKLASSFRPPEALALAIPVPFVPPMTGVVGASLSISE